MLYGGGLRRSEVVALDVSDYNPETTELRVRHGKGQKARICYATNGAKLALDAWFALRGSEPGPLFWPADGRGRPLVNRRMTDQAVLLLLQRRAKQARVSEFTPHDLRRTFISDLLDAGADMATVQRLAGHRTSRQPHGTTAAERRRSAERPSCCMCRSSREAAICTGDPRVAAILGDQKYAFRRKVPRAPSPAFSGFLKFRRVLPVARRPALP